LSQTHPLLRGFTTRVQTVIQHCAIASLHTQCWNVLLHVHCFTPCIAGMMAVVSLQNFGNSYLLCKFRLAVHLPYSCVKRHRCEFGSKLQHSEFHYKHHAVLITVNCMKNIGHMFYLRGTCTCRPHLAKSHIWAPKQYRKWM